MKDPKSQVRRHLDRLVSGLRDLLPLALQKWDVDAIHDARVSTRRLRAAIDVLGSTIPLPECRRFQKVLRKLRRKLGPLRDADVMTGHLREFAARSRFAHAAQWAQQRMEHRRTELHQCITEEYSYKQALADLSVWWTIPINADSLDEQASLLLADALPSQLAAFSDRAAALSPSATPHSHPVPAHDPHALRIAGKLLRYTIELAAVVGHNPPAKVFKTFKRLQDALGLWHDHVVLSDQVLRLTLEEQVALHDQSLYADVLSLARQACARAQFHLRQFSALWTRQGPTLRHEIEKLFPPRTPAVSLNPATPECTPGIPLVSDIPPRIQPLAEE